MKNWKFDYDLSAIATSILTGFIGLAVIGYSSPAISAESDRTNGKGKEKPQVTLASSTQKSQDLPLQKGMTYGEARQIILKQGWRPNPNVESNLRSPVVKAIFDRGFIEIEDCSGTGEAPCRYEFVNDKGEILFVITAGRDRLVRDWGTEPKADAQKEPASGTIQAGRYWVGPTDEGLEIQAESFRYFDESGIDKRWQPISELKYIKNGVVFYGENYWCLSTMMPKNGISTCTANGWVKAETRPFSGTQRFNFLGGTGTGYTITIEHNGDTLVQLHGTAGSSIIYKGKFSNPIVLEDGKELQFEGDKIYMLLLGQSIEECKSSGSPCQANLY